MNKDISELWSESSKKEKARNKEKSKELFGKSKEHNLPSFEDSKSYLADIENQEQRKKYLESLVGYYKVHLSSLEQINGNYRKEHLDDFETGRMELEEVRVQEEIAQIYRDMEYFQTRLDFNDLDFSEFKRKPALPMLYPPFPLEDAALYTGLSINTMNKKPEYWGADMSGSTYLYYPEKLDIRLREKGKTSPYWEYPELIIYNNPEIATSSSIVDKQYERIAWRGSNPSVQLKALVEYWDSERFINLGTQTVGQYIDNHFCIEERECKTGDRICWLSGQKELLAFLIAFDEMQLIELKSAGEETSYMTSFVKEHFIGRDKSGSQNEYKGSSLSANKSTVNRIIRSSGSILTGIEKKIADIYSWVNQTLR